MMVNTVEALVEAKTDRFLLKYLLIKDIKVEIILWLDDSYRSFWIYVTTDDNSIDYHFAARTWMEALRTFRTVTCLIQEIHRRNVQ